MTKQSVYKLCIRENRSVYATMIVGYLADGSYFLRDLSNKNETYHIIKMSIDDVEMSGFGTHLIPIERVKQWKTTHKPKLIHHISGAVQVSGTGIISGNFKSIKTPKGVQVISPHNTDGGPMCGATVWGLSEFKEIAHESISDDHVIFSSHEISDLHPNLHEDAPIDAYTFELFYMDKKIMEKVDKTSAVRITHPHFGLMTMKILNHGTGNPALFGVVCRKSKIGFGAEHGVAYGGGASVSANGYHEQIQITYPFNGMKEVVEKRKIKNLDLNPRFRFWCLIDDFISKRISK